MNASLSQEILSGYFDEVRGYVPALSKGLEMLKERPDRPDGKKILAEIQRLVHTVKGASAMVGVVELSQMAGLMESAVEKILRRRLVPSPAALDAMSLAVENLHRYCQAFRNGGVEEGELLKSTAEALDALDLGGEREEGAAIQDSCEEADIGRESGDAAPGVSSPSRTGSGNPHGNVGMPDDLLESFFQEADEHLDEIGRIVADLNETVKGPEQLSDRIREKIRMLRRCVHTLKGSGAIVGLKEFAGFAHAAEDLLDWLFESASEINPEILKMVADSAGVLESYLESPEKFPSGMLEELALEFKAESGKIMESEPAFSDRDESSEGEIAADPSALVSPSEIVVSGRNDRASLRQARSRYLRVDMEEIDRLVNLAGEIAIAAGALERELNGLSGVARELDTAGERLGNLARDLNSRFEVKALEQFAGVASGQGASNSELFKEFDDLELDRYSKLNVTMRALDESAVDVATISARLSESCADLDGQLNLHKAVSREIRDALARVRMVPMSVLSRRLQRTVAETRATLGKKVELEISGEKTELDRLVWEKLADPLMHLLRNALDHGIESPEKRKELGKPETGTLKLSACREGNLVTIKISDDGAGIDYDAIRASEKCKDFFGNSAPASEEMLSELIFRPGFSTSGEIGEISGRGIGLDVVRENVRELKGNARVYSQKGRGVEFVVTLPLTLASARVFIFKAAGRIYALPIADIREVFRFGPELVAMNPRRSVRIGEKETPLFFLEELLDGRATDIAFPPGVSASLAVSIRFGDESAAIFIEETIEHKEVVVKSLGSHLKYVRGVAGCAILGDGSVAPVLNAAELLETASNPLPEKPKKRRRAPDDAPAEILVVDDSVSIRGVVSRMITSRGWTARTAVNGMDALEKLRERTSDLVVLDIEMPRMNGFECLGAMKSHDEFKRIPVVMLTSRTASKHRKKASSLGASGFVVKPYNETEFAMLIQRLLENPAMREGL